MASTALWTLLVAYRNMLFSTHSIIYHIYYNILGSQKISWKINFQLSGSFLHRTSHTVKCLQHSDIPILNEACL